MAQFYIALKLSFSQRFHCTPEATGLVFYAETTLLNSVPGFLIG